MPDKKKKVKIIYVVEKRKKRKKNKTKKKQQTFNKIPLTNEQLNVPKMFAGNMPANLFSQAQSAYFPTIPQIVTPAPKTDWEDLVKKLIESQSKSIQTALGTPKPTPTPTLVETVVSSSSSSSSSSSYKTPTELKTPKTFSAPSKSKQGFVRLTPVNGDETDLEEEIRQQMPPSLESLTQANQAAQAAQAASSISSGGNPPASSPPPLREVPEFIEHRVSGKKLYNTKTGFSTNGHIYTVYLSSGNAPYVNQAGIYKPFKDILSAPQREKLRTQLASKGIKYPE